jgi:hypothetical protein
MSAFSKPKPNMPITFGMASLETFLNNVLHRLQRDGNVPQPRLPTKDHIQSLLLEKWIDKGKMEEWIKGYIALEGDGPDESKPVGREVEPYDPIERPKLEDEDTVDVPF